MRRQACPAPPPTARLPQHFHQRPTREIKGLQFVFVEIPKFRPETARDKKIRLLWLRFLQEIEQGEFDPPQALLDYPPTAEALDIAREAGFSEAELFAYQQYWDGVSTEVTLLGERTALALEQGLRQGMERGALAEKQTIARKLLDVLGDPTIADKTGLTADEVAQLRRGD